MKAHENALISAVFESTVDAPMYSGDAISRITAPVKKPPKNQVCLSYDHNRETAHDPASFPLPSMCISAYLGEQHGRDCKEANASMLHFVEILLRQRQRERRKPRSANTGDDLLVADPNSVPGGKRVRGDVMAIVH